MTDIAALISAVSSLSGLVGAVGKLMGQIGGKEDQKRLADLAERLAEMEEAVPNIGALSWSLHDYVNLQAAAATLKTQLEIFQRSYPPSPPAEESRQIFEYTVQNQYRSAKSFYTVNLAALSDLVSTKAFDEGDKRAIRERLTEFVKAFAEADTLLAAKELDFSAFRRTLNSMSDTVDALLGLAQGKVSLIVESLMAVGAQYPGQ